MSNTAFTWAILSHYIVGNDKSTHADNTLIGHIIDRFTCYGEEIK